MSFQDDTDNDLTEMTGARDFGVVCVFTPDSGPGESLEGIFDEDAVDVNIGDEAASTRSHVPSLTINKNDISKIPTPRIDTFTIEGNVYPVWDVERDGTGQLLVWLLKP